MTKPSSTTMKKNQLNLLLVSMCFMLIQQLNAQSFDCPKVDYRNNGNTANFINSTYYYPNAAIPDPTQITGKITLKFPATPSVVPFITGVFVGNTQQTCVVGPPSQISQSGGFYLVSYGVYVNNLPAANSSYDLQFSYPNNTNTSMVTGAGSFLKVCSYSNTGAVLTPPTLNTQPVNVNECQGRTVTFSITATANNGGTLAYQWRKNGVAINNAAGKISGATTSTLTISNTALTDAAIYDALITETTGNTASSGAFTISHSATLLIYQTFNTGAISTNGQTICYGAIPSTINNVTLANGGNDTISYQWQYSTNDGVTWTDITGATASSLSFASGLTTTTTFRRLAGDGRCAATLSTSTGTWKVTVPTATLTASSSKTSYNGSDLRCFNGSDGQATISPVMNDEGDVINYVAVKEDITERMKLEEEKERLIEELTVKIEDLHQFSYIASHNLRSPVTNLLGILDLLEPDAVQGETNQLLMQSLRKSVGRLNETLNDLINSLVSNSPEIHPWNSISLQDLFDKTCQNLKTMIKNTGGNVSCNFSEQPEWRFNKIYIESVFQNLISNALKYHRPGIIPEVMVTSSIDEGKLILSFKDKGLGMDLKKIGDRLFGMYQRFHRDYDSKGLGLFLVKAHVRAMSGEIRVDSKVNEGTEFILTFNPIE